MAAAAAALANSLGTAGMANHGSNSNPLLSQYAALLGMGRQPGAGPGQLPAEPLHHCTLLSAQLLLASTECNFMSQYRTPISTVNIAFTYRHFTCSDLTGAHLLVSSC